MGMLGKLKGAASLAKQAYDTAATQSAEAQIAGKVLQGPAGRHVHGIETAPKPPPRIEDAAEWERVMRADLAVRDAAREPYLAPDALAAADQPVRARGGRRRRRRAAPRGERPRRPARARLRRLSRARPHRPAAARARVVEWDVVHAATGPLAPAEPPADAYFDAATRWVERRVGDTRAVRRGPRARLPRPCGHRARSARSASRARSRSTPTSGDDEHDHRLIARVEGVHVFHAGPAGAAPPPVGAGPARGRPPDAPELGRGRASPCTRSASSARGCRRRSRTSR